MRLEAGLLLLPLLASACGQSVGRSGEVPGPRFSASPHAIVVARDDTSFPDACRPRSVARLVLDFFGAFNRGDGSELARMLAPEPTFQWYSAPGPDGRVVARYRRSTALAYLAQRHRHGERLDLVMIDVGYEKERYIGHVSYVITRQANDLVPIGEPGLVVGKGAIDCGSSTVAVWSMGPVEQEVAWPCPVPGGWEVGNGVVTCARG